MKKQQYASVLPYISIGNTQVNNDYSFVLNNNGIGPAFIDEINIHYNDTIYRNTDVYDFYSRVITKNDTVLNHKKITHSTVRKGMLVPEREAIYMLKLGRAADNFEEKHMRLREWLNNNIKVEVKYSSVYKEKWRVIYPGFDGPEKIE
ncbi:hypothetical protein GTQ40_11210 [Flavobacteriaceae bacterium R38]|nr:hypothetical protein [Flavobacteriaceae bacterium R38]